MADPLLPIGDGHTPLADEDYEDYDGLIPSYIVTRGELNDVETANIADALVRRRVPGTNTVLDPKYLRDLHRDMFGQVWGWAGKDRTREVVVGVDPDDVAVQLRVLTDNARHWVADEVFPIDELATRFHHRLVQIHVFRNGNGRHGRAATDLVLRSLGNVPFTWGAGLAVTPEELRARYIAALRRADIHDFANLVAFVRT